MSPPVEPRAAYRWPHLNHKSEALARRVALPWRSDSDQITRVSGKNVCPALPKSPDALAPVTVEVVVVVRPQLSVSQSVALDRLVSGDTRQLPTNTQPRPLFDGHVITRLSGERIVTQEDAQSSGVNHGRTY